ncbi:hypothetical protein [Desulfonatronum sp. SC1]|uniref:hypothetical protein n=1 Tax=Desulfonatronum sp. SC1 TaxID=2109626 RepID=UPI0011B20D00|nr:hypothetical protein [Desulfonatronum sp. SC1]
MTLALEVRSLGVDLLNANREQLAEYIEQAEAGELEIDPARFQSLLTYMEDRAYLTWEPVLEGQEISEGDLIRGEEGASFTLRDGAGGESVVDLIGIFSVDSESMVFVQLETTEVTPESTPETTPGVTPDAMDAEPSPVEAGPPGDLSPRALKLYEFWHELTSAKDFPLKADGPLAIQESEDVIEMDLPLVAYTLENRESGENILRLRYEVMDEQHLRFALHLPAEVWLHDMYELPIGLARYAEHQCSGIWSDVLDGPSVIEFQFKQIEFLPDALTAQEGAQRRMTLDDFHFSTAMQEGANERWNSNGQLNLLDLRFLEADNRAALQLGSLSVNAKMTDYDFDTLVLLPLALIEMADTLNTEDLATLIDELLQGTGNANINLSLKDLIVPEMDDLRLLQLGSLEIQSDMKTTSDDESGRDFISRYQVGNLNVITDDGNLTIANLSLESALSGLNMRSLAQLAEFDLFADDNPFKAFQNLLEGLHFNFSVAGMQGQYEDLDLSGLDDLAFGLRFSGLNKPLTDINLTYSHAGLREVEAIPPGLTPQKMALRLSLIRAPILEALVTGFFAGPEATPLLLELFAEHDTKLELRELDLASQVSQIRLEGLASVDGPESSLTGDMPVLQIETTLDVSNLDILVETLANLMDSEEDTKHLNAVAAFIKLAAEEQTDDSGTVSHKLRINGNNQGEITANGKDVMPIIQMIFE